MLKPKPESYYASIAGVHFTTDKKHSYSPTFEVRDRNMRRRLASNYKPFTHEVPFGGSAWEVHYGAEFDAFYTYSELDEMQKLIDLNS